MLRNILKTVLSGSTKSNRVNFSTGAEKWDLLSAVCLERKPLITPIPTELEKQFQSLLNEIEHEKSYKSNHEIRHAMDLQQAKLLKEGDTDVDAVVKETAQDFVDASMEELSKFKMASRTSAADKANDLKSLNRKLDRHLVLLVNQKIGEKTHFLPPQGLRLEGETMRQAAERVLKETCGPEIKAQIYGNAPAGFYKYRYPKEVQNKKNACGAKVFVYFARHQNGQVAKKEVDYKWADRSELQKIIPETYHKSLSQFLINEN